MRYLSLLLVCLALTPVSGQDVQSRLKEVVGDGNSGNSTEPHLHLQLQNTRDIHKATGARLVFSRILVNGAPREEYIPVKEDFIKRID